MPVIAWNYGAMSETILNNETGFLVNSQEEIEELIKTDAVSQIKPKNCTNWAQKFSYESMINRVEEICFEAIETGGW
jgi:glycosyltransferase involved in cell wall biosynthesis